MSQEIQNQQEQSQEQIEQQQQQHNSQLFEVFIRGHEDNDALGVMRVDSQMTLRELKKQYQREVDQFMFVERQVLHKRGKPLKLNYQTLEEYGIGPGQTLHLQDVGHQVPMVLAKFLVYLGPILMYTYFNSYGVRIYLKTNEPSEYWHVMQAQDNRTVSQLLAYWMVIIHFSKKIFETMFLHKYGNQTLSLENMLWECSRYWLVLGLFAGFYQFHPFYQEPHFMRLFMREHNVAIVGSIVLYSFCELMNLLCHIHFYQVKEHAKREGVPTREKIPHLHGFNMVSSAHYFWEYMTWIILALVSQSLPVFLFVVHMFFVLNRKAQKKHWRFVQQYGDDYPAHRHAFIPFII